MLLSDIARTVEDRLHRGTVPALKCQGWRPRVIPYDGYGTNAPIWSDPTAPQHQEQHQDTIIQRSAAGTHRHPASASRRVSSDFSQSVMFIRPTPTARVLARMAIRPQGAPAEGPLFRFLPDTLPISAAQARSFAVTRLSGAQHSWHLLIEVPMAFLPVMAHMGRASVRTRADHSGYVDVVVCNHDLKPGWYEVRIEAMGAHAVTAKVLTVSEGPRPGIISDIGDTAMVMHVPRALMATQNQLVKHPLTRESVPGMAELYSRIRAIHLGTSVMYPSTGAWNVIPTLRSFSSRHGFPSGPALVTNWGPTNAGWFHSSIEYKHTELCRLMIDLPQITWIPFDDDGQHNPRIYGEAARHHADRIAAVIIRRLIATQQVPAGGLAAHSVGIGPKARALAEIGAPVVAGVDGYELVHLLPRELLEAVPRR